MNRTIEQALNNIHSQGLALHPNSVVAQTQKLDSSITAEDVETYMQDTYGWSSDFYDYYGQSPDTDVDK